MDIAERTKGLNNQRQQKLVAVEKLRATILSDGNLSITSKNAYFRLNLSDNRRDLIQRELIPVRDLLMFLQYFVKEVLEPLDIKPCSGHPKIQSHITKSKTGEGLPGVLLETRVSELLTELYYECYSCGKRTIPESFILTDVFLAWYFMFDGGSQWDVRGRTGIDVRLFTQGYSFSSVELFEGQLRELGISTGRRHGKAKDGSGVIISVLQDSVNRFMGIVDPHIVPPYRYKVKYRGSCPPALTSKASRAS